jgi:hypothetical protein
MQMRTSRAANVQMSVHTAVRLIPPPMAQRAREVFLFFYFYFNFTFFFVEPLLPNFQLWQAVVLSSHIAYFSKRGMPTTAKWIMQSM